MQHGVDVVWWTDHDGTPAPRDASATVHFTSLAEEQGNGPPWLWFVRTQVRDGFGAIVATSNPVWLLRRAPATGIPAARQA